jgi:hypothetical protein
MARNFRELERKMSPASVARAKSRAHAMLQEMKSSPTAPEVSQTFPAAPPPSPTLPAEGRGPEDSLG